MLVKTNGNLYIMLMKELHTGRDLFTASATAGGGCSCRTSSGGRCTARRRDGGRLGPRGRLRPILFPRLLFLLANVLHMFRNVVQDTLFVSPAEEIHLPDGCEEVIYAFTLEDDAVVAAEGVKEFLTVCLCLTLIVQIYKEFLTVQHVSGVMLLGVVSDEDINKTKTVVPVSLHRIHEFLERVLVLNPVVVFDETHDEQLPPTWDVFTTGLVETTAIRFQDVGLFFNDWTIGIWD